MMTLISSIRTLEGNLWAKALPLSLGWPTEIKGVFRLYSKKISPGRTKYRKVSARTVAQMRSLRRCAPRKCCPKKCRVTLVKRPKNYPKPILVNVWKQETIKIMKIHLDIPKDRVRGPTLCRLDWTPGWPSRTDCAPQWGIIRCRTAWSRWTGRHKRPPHRSDSPLTPTRHSRLR